MKWSHAIRETTRTEEETAARGAELARALAPGDVVLITGDLGVGKTVFVRGALRELGVAGPITSPTFTVAARYTGDDVQVSHLDLYRLGAFAAEDAALIEDEIGPDRLTFIEWPQIATSWVNERGHVAATVDLAHAGGDERSLVIERGR